MCFPFFKRRYQKVKDFKKSLPCSCEICGASFDTMEDLIGHMVLHSTEDINKAIRVGYGTVRCKRCWYPFPTVASMEEHHCVTIIQCLSPTCSSDSLQSVVIHGDDL